MVTVCRAAIEKRMTGKKAEGRKERLKARGELRIIAQRKGPAVFDGHVAKALRWRWGGYWCG